MSDLPREALMEKAQEALLRSPEGSVVHFKYTCALCGERCTLAEPNTLRERGECHLCGYETTIVEGGFMLVMAMGGGRRASSNRRPTES